MSNFKYTVIFSALLLLSACVSDGAMRRTIPETRITKVIWYKLPSAEVKEKWAKTEGAKRLGHKQVRGFAVYSKDGTWCRIYTEHPQNLNDTRVWATVVHELQHCIFGAWHD